MSLNSIVDNIYQAFKARAADARVILLHAKGRYRTALLSRMLSSREIPIYYYAMGTDDVDIESFLAGFTHDLADQISTFGAHVNQVGFRHPLDLPALLNAFVRDLNELSDEPYILLLDEFDRAEIADDLQQFLEQLIDMLPPQCKLVISSRNLPRLPWMSLIAQKKAVMLKDAELISSDFYENQAENKARLDIQGFGPGHVLLDGDPISAWEGHLPRLLFFFALERPVVTRSEICQAFWPELNNDQAVNVFHVTKRRLHKALEPMGVDVLVHEDGYYRVNPELSIHYDVVDFVSALVEGRSSAQDDSAHMAAWQRAIDVYQRPFLQGHNEDWIMKRRQEYQTGYLEALSGMANVRLNENRPETALALLQRAVTENPSRQDIHRQVMHLYSELGRRSEAASHFQRLKDNLADSGSSLEAETQALYEELMS
jgi:DNA-binding SARP family transcriptional activator